VWYQIIIAVSACYHSRSPHTSLRKATTNCAGQPTTINTSHHSGLTHEEPCLQLTVELLCIHHNAHLRIDDDDADVEPAAYAMKLVSLLHMKDRKANNTPYTRHAVSGGRQGETDMDQSRQSQSVTPRHPSANSWSRSVTLGGRPDSISAPCLSINPKNAPSRSRSQACSTVRTASLYSSTCFTRAPGGHTSWAVTACSSCVRPFLQARKAAGRCGLAVALKYSLGWLIDRQGWET